MAVRHISAALNSFEVVLRVVSLLQSGSGCTPHSTCFVQFHQEGWYFVLICTKYMVIDVGRTVDACVEGPPLSTNQSRPECNSAVRWTSFVVSAQGDELPPAAPAPGALRRDVRREQLEDVRPGPTQLVVRGSRFE